MKRFRKQSGLEIGWLTETGETKRERLTRARYRTIGISIAQKRTREEKEGAE